MEGGSRDLVQGSWQAGAGRARRQGSRRQEGRWGATHGSRGIERGGARGEEGSLAGGGQAAAEGLAGKGGHCGSLIASLVTGRVLRSNYTSCQLSASSRAFPVAHHTTLSIVASCTERSRRLGGTGEPHV